MHEHPLNSVRKTWAILEPSQRRRAIWLTVLMTIGMLLEMVGIGIIVPALTILSGGLAHNSAAFLRLRETLGNPTNPQLIALGLVALLGLYIVKTAFSVFLVWTQARFVANVQTSLAGRLFSRYLCQPWTFHLQRNSASMINSVVGEVGAFANVLNSLLMFATDGLIVTGIVLMLLIIEPIGALGVALVLGTATWLFLFLMQQRLVSWGSRRRTHDIQRTKLLQQGLAGAKEVKLAGCESRFIDDFTTEAAAGARMQSRLMAAQQLPRLWYELMAVAALTLLGVVLALQDSSTSALVSRIGLFAVAAFRVLPSLNRMMLTWQSVRFFDTTIASLWSELQIPLVPPPRDQAERLDCSTGIVVEDVVFRYPGAATPALDTVRLRVGHGQSVGIIGNSGAGKSTLVDILLGLLTPEQGAVRVGGQDIHSCLRAWQRCVGYVPQTIYLMDDSIRRNVAFGVADSEIDDIAVARALAAAQLAEFVESLPHAEETLVGERGVRLSGGQRQRVGIARALYHDPPVLVLDEATSALDTATEKEVMAAVNNLHGSKTLVIIAHRLSTVANCDEIIKLEAGRVVKAGRFDEVTSP